MEIDRTKVCPFLLRCFWRLNRGNPLNVYKQTVKGTFPNQEVQIYTWQDASLKEIGELIKDVVPAARDINASFIFNLVFLNKDGNFQIKQVGKVSNRSGPDDDKSLASIRFEIGDYLDVVVSNQQLRDSQQNNSNYGRNNSFQSRSVQQQLNNDQKMGYEQRQRF